MPAGTPSPTAASVLTVLPKARLTELGAVVATDDKLTPTGLQTWLQAETQRYGPVIKAAGQFAD